MSDNLIATSAYDSVDVLVPWSGGFDSTALILKAIKERKSVAWCAYTTANNVNQSASESLARLRISAYLRARNITIVGQETDRFDVHVPFAVRYAVPRLILASTVLGHPAKEVWLGYTRSDQKCADWKFEDHAILASLIPPLWTLTREVPPPIVRFPFLDLDKADICREYYRDYRPVFDMLATCERGYDNARLCNCEKCLKLESLRTILDKSL